MHAVFMVYGTKQSVDFFLGELEHQKFPLRMYKEGEQDKIIYMQGRLCRGVGGVIELGFPKEHMDVVLTSLSFHHNHYPKLGKLRMWLMRIGLKCEPIPKFDTSKGELILIKDNVGLIPIGVRYDGEMLESQGEWAGWTHEAI